MDGNPPEPEAFAAELRAWLSEHFTPDLAEALRDHWSDEAFDAHRKWNATLVDAGYGAIAWPIEFGGRDAGHRRAARLRRGDGPRRRPRAR